MKIFRILLVLFPLLMFSGTSAAQVQQCGSRENIVQILETRAQEKLTSVGFVDSKRVVEIFVNKNIQTWTIIGSSLTGDGDKISCILFYGKTWIIFEELVGAPASF
ncbi:hypothetical protein LCGC14_2932040 [marine sediment metagenome]|uniref:Uncharacterized protein n=1 Tax=marine sediment metagenome TaxID=412755 RepID=A0A0F8XKK3_9ZZZZ